MFQICTNLHIEWFKASFTVWFRVSLKADDVPEEGGSATNAKLMCHANPDMQPPSKPVLEKDIIEDAKAKETMVVDNVEARIK